MSSTTTNFTYQNVLDLASKLGYSQGSWGRCAEELRKDAGYERSEVHELTLKALTLEA